MAERDLFDQLAELPGEPPSSDFVSELEARLRAVRTDVGPATPTDHLIEGVVPLPESGSTRRGPLLFAAAAVVSLIVATIALLTVGDDEDSGPAVVTPGPELDDVDPEPAVDPLAGLALDVASAWMAAVEAGDEDAWLDLHDLGTAPGANLMARGLTDLSRDEADAAYLASLRAFHEELDAAGSALVTDECEAMGPGMARCSWTVDAFGERADVELRGTADLTVSASGQVVAAMLTQVPTDPLLWSDLAEVRPFTTETEAACFVAKYVGPGCGDAAAANTLRYLQLFRPELLGVAADEGVALAFTDAVVQRHRDVANALMAPDATVLGSPYGQAFPDGSLATAAVRADWDRAWDAVAETDARLGWEYELLGCEESDDGFRCSYRFPILGAGSEPHFIFAMELGIDGGLVSGFRLEQIWDPADVPERIQELPPDEFAALVAAYQDCLPSGFSAPGCPARGDDYLIAVLQAAAPDYLVLPTE